MGSPFGKKCNQFLIRCSKSLEISIDKVNRLTGMNITIVTNSSRDNEGYELLRSFGMPFIIKK